MNIGIMFVCSHSHRFTVVTGSFYLTISAKVSYIKMERSIFKKKVSMKHFIFATF